MTPEEFARIPFVGVSPQTVRKWCRQGMPHRSEPLRGNVTRIIIEDQRAACDWIRTHRSPVAAAAKKLPVGRGGNRGGGRPPSKPAPPQPSGHTGQLPVAPAIDASSIDRAIELDRTLAAMEGREPDDITYTVAGLMSLDATRVVQLKLVEEVLSKRVERLAAERELVSVDEATRSWVEATTVCARKLRESARSASADLAQEFRLGAAHTETARRLIEARIDEALKTLQTGIFGGPLGAEDA